MMPGNSQVYQYRFNNGLRMVAWHCPQAVVEVTGVAVDIGSRDESPEDYGLAHFVEHTLFKGSRRHKAAYVNSRMEVVGGELNAYTTKEETMLYTIAPSGTLARALPLLGELVFEAAFPDADIEREREVVLDEIASYLDSPAEAVMDDFEDLVYSGSGPGHNILGSEETVRRFTANDCRRWVDKWFTPEAMLAFYYGPEHPECVFNHAEKSLGACVRVEHVRHRAIPHKLALFSETQSRNGHQSHTVMGARIPGLDNPAQPAYTLLLNILGGPSANSLLNIDLREKRGLVYAVDASRSLLTDAGLATVYFGCDSADTLRCERRVRSVIQKLAERVMSDKMLKRWKNQLDGQIRVGMVNPVEEILGRARRILHGANPCILTYAGYHNALDRVTANDLCVAAQSLAECSKLTFN